jgi:H+/Cl- antiporter ClcA
MHTDQISESPSLPTGLAENDENTKRLTTTQQVVSAWPILLFVFGGLIGGLFGGIAAGVNAWIMSTTWPRLVKYPLVVLSGLCAIVAWLIVVALFHSLAGSA